MDNDHANQSEINRLEAALAAAQAEIARLTEALSPSGDTKAAYHGDFSFEIPDCGIDDDGEEYEEWRKVYVPWTTVKEIMATIHSRALKDKP